MAKEIVTRCTCDACGKECKERFVAVFGQGKWSDDDTITDKLSRDLCYDCYTQLIDLIDARKVKRVKEAPVKRGYGSPLTPGESKGYIADFERGLSDKSLAAKYHLTLSQVMYRNNKLRKSGHIRGILKKMGNPDNKKHEANTEKTVVDRDGLVLHIG